MGEFTAIALTFACILAPVLLLLLVGLSYFLGTGALRLPGVSHGDEPTGKDWDTAVDTVRGTARTLGAVVGSVGGSLGLLGFLMPWVRLNLGGGGALSLVGSLNGSLSGIGLALQSFVGSIALFSSNRQGAVGIGIVLLLVSLLAWLVALALLVTAFVSWRVISVPLKLGKADLKRTSKLLLILGVIALCLSLVFLAAMQATVGGIQAGAGDVNLGLQMGIGFWITLGGLVLALVGAWTSNVLSDILATWATNLSRL